MTVLSCPNCGWTGTSDETETSELTSGDKWRCCPECQSTTVRSEAVQEGFVGVRDEKPDDTALKRASDNTLHGAVHVMNESPEPRGDAVILTCQCGWQGDIDEANVNDQEDVFTGFHCPRCDRSNLKFDRIVAGEVMAADERAEWKALPGTPRMDSILKGDVQTIRERTKG